MGISFPGLLFPGYRQALIMVSLLNAERDMLNGRIGLAVLLVALPIPLMAYMSQISSCRFGVSLRFITAIVLAAIPPSLRS